MNGEAVYANGDDGEGMGSDFDPSHLCSVEITADRDSSESPPPPTSPLRKKMKKVFISISFIV